MPSGLCANCGPGGAKTLTSPKQIKRVYMVVPDECGAKTVLGKCLLRASEHGDMAQDPDAVTSHVFVRPGPIYLCARCRRELGYA